MTAKTLSPTLPETPFDSSEPAGSQAAVLEFEEGLGALFGDLAELFGNPRSYGLIYGTLFASREPLSMEAIAERLGVGIGSVSMGLRRLEEFGAIERERGTGRGTALFFAKLEMRLLVGGFLRERVLPRIAATGTQVEALTSLVPSLPPEERKVSKQRLERLSRWHSRAKSILPFIEKLLGGG
ncbi:MAG: hypothetical protein WEB60_08020 [Terrimicrobiaceae bacterium]